VLPLVDGHRVDRVGLNRVHRDVGHDRHAVQQNRSNRPDLREKCLSLYFLTGPQVVGVGRAAPQLEGFAEQGDRPRGRGELGLLEKLVESPGVHAVRCQPNGVAGAGADDDTGARAGGGHRLEPLAQVADVGLQGAAGAGRCLPAPHRVGQPVGGHHLALGDHEEREHRPLPSSTEIDRQVAVRGRELPEDVKAQPRTPVHATPVAGCAPERRSCSLPRQRLSCR